MDCKITGRECSGHFLGEWELGCRCSEAIRAHANSYQRERRELMPEEKRNEMRRRNCEWMRRYRERKAS